MMMHFRLLYQIRMGYVDINKQNAHQSIAYYPEEHVYDHDLSVQSVGRQFETLKLRDIIDLELYLNLPNDICDDLITGMLMGAEDRREMEANLAAQKKAAEDVEKEKTAQKMSQIHK